MSNTLYGPKIVYGSGPTVLLFVGGVGDNNWDYCWPRDFTCYAQPVSHSNVASSGAVVETIVESLPLMVSFTMPALRIGNDNGTPGGELAAWAAFMQSWALLGNTFDFYPCIAINEHYHCVIEEQAKQKGFHPTRVAPGLYSESFVFRILVDSLTPTAPDVVIRRFYGQS
jgi:hypothetical protein